MSKSNSKLNSFENSKTKKKHLPFVEKKITNGSVGMEIPVYYYICFLIDALNEIRILRYDSSKIKRKTNFTGR